MFFCLVIISIIILITIVIIFSSIEINIQNFNLVIPKIEQRLLNDRYKISISLKLKNFNFLKVDITKTKLEKLQIKTKAQMLEKKIINNKNRFDIKLLDILRKLKINVKELDLQINIGTENSALTSYIVGIISTILAFLLKNQIRDYNKQKFIVSPIYMNKNLLNIKLDSIFEIKMIHIIYIIYILIKKGRDEKYDRTSNRRSYGYSYE